MLRKYFNTCTKGRFSGEMELEEFGTLSCIGGYIFVSFIFVGEGAYLR